MTPEEIAARAAPNAGTGMRAPSIGVALSGGGYRAMLYHLGALRRLNEAGLLSVVQRFSVVSGGALLGAVLARRWSEMGFGTDGVAVGFDRVETDVFAIADRTIDLRAAIRGRLPRSTPAAIVADALRGLIGDVCLSELPTTPRFTFNATNMDTGTLFRWAPEYAADYAVGMIERPDVPLAVAVAASAAFPPWLSPLRVTPPGTWVDPQSRMPIAQPPAQLTLTDGGVYDNLGLESLKSFHTVLASDGGSALPRAPRMRVDPLSQAIRAAFVGNENLRRQRRRDLVGDLGIPTTARRAVDDQHVARRLHGVHPTGLPNRLGGTARIGEDAATGTARPDQAATRELGVSLGGPGAAQLRRAGDPRSHYLPLGRWRLLTAVS